MAIERPTVKLTLDLQERIQRTGLAKDLLSELNDWIGAEIHPELISLECQLASVQSRLERAEGLIEEVRDWGGCDSLPFPLRDRLQSWKKGE